MESSSQDLFKFNIAKACIYKFLVMFQLFAGILIPFFTIWGGIKFSQVMILQAVFTTTIFLSEIPTGAIADRFGRKISLMLGSLTIMTAVIVYSSYPNIWIFVLGEIIWGIGFSLISGADQAFLFDSLKELGRDVESKKIFGRWESYGIVALIVAAPVGSLIAKYYGLRFTMFLTSIPLFLSAIVAMTYKEPCGEQTGRTGNYLKTIIEGARYLKNHQTLKIIVFDYASVYVFSMFIMWVYQFVLTKLNVSIGWFGFVRSLMTFFQIVVLNNFINLDKFCCGKKRYIWISAVLVGASYVAMGFVQNGILAILTIIIISAFGLTRKTLFQNYMNKHIESKHRATTLSVVSMLLSISSAIVNIIFGYLVEWNVSLGLVIIGVLVIVFTFFSRLKEHHLVD